MQSQSKVRVAVLMGGKTAEHDISLQTGVEIANALDRDLYEVVPLVITKQGQWVWPGNALRAPEDALSLADVTGAVDTSADAADTESASTRSALARLEPFGNRPVDVVFIALHGPNGEDGTVQGMLELLDVPYTGSGVMASAVAMNKPLTKRLFRQAGLTVPPGATLSVRRWQSAPTEVVEELAAHPGLPCVVKPIGQGSSMGTSLCSDAEELREAVDLALRYEPTVMIEEYIRGTELTCGILEDTETREPVPLPVIEIVPKATTFFDFQAKYDPDLTDEIVPARLPDEVAARAQEIAVRTHLALECSAMSRTDMILRDGELYVMELNTIPGMTPYSLLPKAVQCAGISFPELLHRLIRMAIQDHELLHWQNGHQQT